MLRDIAISILMAWQVNGITVEFAYDVVGLKKLPFATDHSKMVF